MKRMTALAVCVGVLSPAASAMSASPPSPGQEVEITRRYSTSEEGGDGSSGSSNGNDAILERVIAVRDGGVELEYDLPRDTPAEGRLRQWQLPARVFRPTNGAAQLVNRGELETRLQAWLKSAGLTRAACGKTIFTWTAIRIECDPQSVLEMIKAYDLQVADLRDGASYVETSARAPGILKRTATGPKSETFAVVMDIDPAFVQRRNAEADVAVGEIMREPVTLDAALRRRGEEKITGTLSVTLDADPTGAVWRRTVVTRMQTRKPDGSVETLNGTETVERRPTSGDAGAR